MKEEPKILEEGESTFRNGGGSMCGGVISESLMMSDPWAYMMAYYLPDEHFKTYKELKEKGWDKHAKVIFDKFAKSMI